MKNLFKVFSNLNRAHSAKVPLLIIAIVAVIEFSMVSCIEEDIDDNGSSGDSSSDFTYEENNGLIKITKYKGQGGNVTIPSKIGGKPVTVIGDRAFDGCTSLTGITIPNSVTSILEAAFGACSSLTSITIPDSVTQINSMTFINCIGLTSVTISNKVTIIGARAFDGCTGLTGITIPNSVNKIDTSAFTGCAGIANITIPVSVTSINDWAFHGCNSLTSVTFEGTPTIGDISFPGDLESKYAAGGKGTYTRQYGSDTWTIE